MVTKSTSHTASRAEQTKVSILDAARHLFSRFGYHSVTMRAIAKEAGCSHTSIYVYFKDKEALLEALALPFLKQLKIRLEMILEEKEATDQAKLKRIGLELLKVGLGQRNMYEVLFKINAERVDNTAPKLAINQLRNDLFDILKRAIQPCVKLKMDDPMLLAYSRIYYYTLQGIIFTYDMSEENEDQLMDRLGNTFNMGMDVMTIGIRQHIKQFKGGSNNEN